MNSFRILVPLLLSTAFCLAGEQTLVLDLMLTDGSGDKPMIVAWLEKKDGTFVQTLHMFSKDKKYYKDMKVWWTARETDPQDDQRLDGVVGPTPTWTGHQVYKVKVKDLTSGDLVLRVEQRKDKAGVKTRKIPITPNWPGVTLAKELYLDPLIVTIEP